MSSIGSRISLRRTTLPEREREKDRLVWTRASSSFSPLLNDEEVQWLTSVNTRVTVSREINVKRSFLFLKIFEVFRREPLSFSICSTVFDYSYLSLSLFSWMNSVACATTFAFSFDSCASTIREIVHAAVNDNDLPTAHTSSSDKINRKDTAREKERLTERFSSSRFFPIGSSIYFATNRKGGKRREKKRRKETSAFAFSRKKRKRTVADNYAENKGKIDWFFDRIELLNMTFDHQTTSVIGTNHNNEPPQPLSSSHEHRTGR